MVATIQALAATLLPLLEERRHDQSADQAPQAVVVVIMAWTRSSPKLRMSLKGLIRYRNGHETGAARVWRPHCKERLPV